VELPAFERHRVRYLDDDDLLLFQAELLRNPTAGDVIEGTGGLRIIYYYWVSGSQFWLFTVYDKGETEDLSPRERAGLKDVLKTQLLRTLQ
jgi:hypothetical protein